MNDVNRIVICKEDYDNEVDFEFAILDAVKVLLNNNYIMTIKNDDGDKSLGIVVIDFNEDDISYGCDYPYWLSPEEIESAITN